MYEVEREIVKMCLSKAKTYLKEAQKNYDDEDFTWIQNNLCSHAEDCYKAVSDISLRIQNTMQILEELTEGQFLGIWIDKYKMAYYQKYYEEAQKVYFEVRKAEIKIFDIVSKIEHIKDKSDRSECA